MAGAVELRIDQLMVLSHVMHDRTRTICFPADQGCQSFRPSLSLLLRVEHFNYSTSSFEPCIWPFRCVSNIEPDHLSKTFSAVYLITSLDFFLLEVYAMLMIAAMSLHNLEEDKEVACSISGLMVYLGLLLLPALPYCNCSRRHMVHTDDLHATVY